VSYDAFAIVVALALVFGVLVELAFEVGRLRKTLLDVVARGIRADVTMRDGGTKAVAEVEIVEQPPPPERPTLPERKR
jgi:hypothetical protein